MKRTIRIEWNEKDGTATLVINTVAGLTCKVTGLSQNELAQIETDLAEITDKILEAGR